jgi:hypothetical protein
LRIEEALVGLLADRHQRLPVLRGEQPSDAEVVGVVDSRLGPQCAAVLEVLLDVRMFVGGLDDRRDTAGDDLGLPRRGPDCVLSAL